jgi:hydroxylaminobenzene mutase
MVKSRNLRTVAWGESQTNMTIPTGGKQILTHGLALILAGLVWGFAPPLTPYPRLAVGAHVQFETNGLLFVVLGILLLKLPHHVGSGAVRVMVVSAWLTWLMALSEAANAWWGASQMLPVAAGQAGAAGAAPWQELVVKLCHIPAALGLILSFVLLIIGFVKHLDPAEQGPMNEA